MTNTTTPSPNQRPSAADSQRTTSLGDADRRAPFLPRRGRGTYIKPRHLLIASLACWAVVAAIIAGVLL